MKQFKLKEEFQNERRHVHGLGLVYLKDLTPKLIVAHASQVGQFYDQVEGTAEPEASAKNSSKSKAQGSTASE